MAIMLASKFLLIIWTFSANAAGEVFDNGRGERSDDVSMGSLQTLVQQQTSLIDRLQADVTAYKTQLDAVSHQLQTMQQQTDASLHTLQRKVDAASKSVAFTARISSDRDHNNHGMTVGEKQTIVFDNVITNVGSAYDPSTGVFTAPVSGAYAFSLHMMSANSADPIYLAIVKNGVVLSMAYAEGSSDVNDQGSSQLTTHLSVGDKVWVRHDGGTMVRGSWWTVFTGFVLHADS